MTSVYHGGRSVSGAKLASNIEIGKVMRYFNSGVCSFRNNHYLCGDFKCRLSPRATVVDG